MHTIEIYALQSFQRKFSVLFCAVLSQRVVLDVCSEVDNYPTYSHNITRNRSRSCNRNLCAAVFLGQLLCDNPLPFSDESKGGFDVCSEVDNYPTLRTALPELPE